MKTKDFKHIYECILSAVSEDYPEPEDAILHASFEFTTLLTGDADEKQEVIDKYDLECCRVCEICGELMTEGWILDCTDVCSDECAAKFFGESLEKFKYRMSDENFIRQAMEWDDCKKKYEDLTEDERGKYLDAAIERTDFYWTEWV